MRELIVDSFAEGYKIETGITPEGAALKLTKTAAIRMCGNSVCPPLAAALVAPNCADLAEGTREAAVA